MFARTLFISAVIAMFGCEAKKDDATSPATAKETSDDGATDDSAADDGATDDGTDGTVTAGQVAILSPTETFSTIQGGLASVANAESTESSTILYPGTVAVAAALTGANRDPSSVCRASGTPTEDEPMTTDGKAQFGAKQAYCDLAMRPDGPDTTRGAIDRIQGMLCAIEGKYTFNGVATDVAMTFDTTCFSEAFSAMVLQEAGTNTATAQVTASAAIDPVLGNTAFDRMIVIDLSQFDMKYTIQIKQDGTSLAAAAILKAPNETSVGDFIAVQLDTSAVGSIRYEGRFADVGESSGIRHLRVLATGTFDSATKEFQAITNLEYLFVDTYSGGGGKLVSVKGSPSTGYFATSQAGNTATTLSTWIDPNQVDTACNPDGACTGNAGISIAQESDFDFFLALTKGSSKEVDANAMFTGQGPLNFAAVTFGAVP